MATTPRTRKITITLPDDQLDEIRVLVAAGKAASTSAFVKHEVGVALDDAAGWREMLEDALQRTGGPLTKDERDWADAILSPGRGRAVPENRTLHAHVVVCARRAGQSAVTSDAADLKRIAPEL